MHIITNNCKEANYQNLKFVFTLKMPFAIEGKLRLELRLAAGGAEKK